MHNIKDSVIIGASLVSLVGIGAAFAYVGTPTPAPAPITHTVEATPQAYTVDAPSIRPCVTEDETPTVGACYWDGGDNGEGLTFTVYSDGSVVYDLPASLK